MSAARLQRFFALTLLSAGIIASANAQTVAEELLVADVKVSHHLIPGLHLKARAEKEPQSAPTIINQPAPSINVRPDVPPVPENRKLGVQYAGATRLVVPSKPFAVPSKVEELWESHCPAPVKVSFFGDYWVSPFSPAANLKKKMFDEVIPLLKWSDFNVVNFEGSITKATARAFPKFPFALKQAPESLKWLSDVGIKYFTRANNHSMDFGWVGAQDTTTAMKQIGASFAGVGKDLNTAFKPMWLEKGGLKIAVFSVTTTYPAEAWAGKNRPGVAHPTQPLMRNAIASVRDEADFIVVAFHWGEELNPAIKPHQAEYAKQALQAGADVIVGHHAHLAQKVDSEIQDGLIVYGLGNFMFSSLSRDAKFGLGAHFEFCRNENSAEGHPNSFRLILTPIMTYNRLTGYKSRPMTKAEFLPFAREYLKKGHFSQNLEFYIPSEGRVNQLSDWLRAGPQASKEGRAVN